MHRSNCKGTHCSAVHLDPNRSREIVQKNTMAEKRLTHLQCGGCVDMGKEQGGALSIGLEEAESGYNRIWINKQRITKYSMIAF